MAYSTDLASLVANQLERFVTLAPHQLAGHVANLDFWLAQARHALAGIDGYGVRFVRLEAAQTHFAAENRSTVSEYAVDDDPHAREPSAPRRVPDRELQKARRALTDAAERFLARCRDAGLLSDAEYSAAADRAGIVDASVTARPR